MPIYQEPDILEPFWILIQNHRIRFNPAQHSDKKLLFYLFIYLFNNFCPVLHIKHMQW